MHARVVGRVGVSLPPDGPRDWHGRRYNPGVTGARPGDIMKRLIPAQLITFWQNNPSCIKADLFVVNPQSGPGLLVTEGPWDITVPATTPGWSNGLTTFKASASGLWKRGKITSEASFKVGSNTMDLTCVPQAGTVFPGTTVGILEAVLNHLFDGATVLVFTAYMPLGGYGTVSAGIETKWRGLITKYTRLGRDKVVFECADPLYLLNQKIPSRIMQSTCGWQFCDDNCGLNPSNYTVNFTGTTGTQNTLTGTALTQPDGYFAQGLVTCLTGNNAGLSQTVKKYASGVITLTVPWLMPVTVGDTFRVIKGCDQTMPTCAGTKYANGTPEPLNFQDRFGGTPFTPPPAAGI